MKKGIALSAATIALALFLVGCEDDEDDSRSTPQSGLLTGTGVVEFVNWVDPSSAEREYVLESTDVLVAVRNTLIMIMRPSGSGFSGGTVSNIVGGDLVEYFYDPDDVEYASSTRIILTEIWVQ
jgi:hypothetical protein